jgi:hypothetical protein
VNCLALLPISAYRIVFAVSRSRYRIMAPDGSAVGWTRRADDDRAASSCEPCFGGGGLGGLV